MEKEQIAALVRQAQSGDLQAMEQLLRLAHTSVSYQCRKIMAALDMMHGYGNNTFRPTGTYTRQQAFVTAYRLMTQIVGSAA